MNLERTRFDIVFGFRLGFDASTQPQRTKCLRLSSRPAQTVVTVVREFVSCAADSKSRVTGAAAAAADEARNGWLQG